MDYLSCSLADFVTRSTTILNNHGQSDDERDSALVDHALAGVTVVEDGDRTRIIVDSLEDLTPYSEMKSDITRKSYITKMEGRSSTLPFKFSIKVLAHMDFTRKISMYDVGAWVYQRPNEDVVDIRGMPGGLFAEVPDKLRTWIVFPKMYHGLRKDLVFTERESMWRRFYQLCLEPALRRTVALLSWMPIPDRTDVLSDDLTEFAATLSELAASTDDFAEFFFIHEVLFQEQPFQGNGRATLLRGLTQFLDVDDDTEWFVRLTWRYSHPFKMLQLNFEEHARFIHTYMSSLSPEEISTLMNNKPSAFHTQYHLRPSVLTNLAGFEIECHKAGQARQDGVRALRAWSMERVALHGTGTTFETHPVERYLLCEDKTCIDSIQPVIDKFRLFALDGAPSAALEAAIMVEVRLDVYGSRTVRPYEGVLNGLLVGVDPAVWWNCKSLRARAVRCILDRVWHAPQSRHKQYILSLQCIAISILHELMNGQSTLEFSVENACREAASYWWIDDNGKEVSSQWERGLYFIGEIVHMPAADGAVVSRMGSDYLLSHDLLLKWMGMDSWPAMQAKFFKRSAAYLPRPRVAERGIGITNRTRTTDVRDTDARPAGQIAWSFTQNGMTFIPSAIEPASVPAGAEEEEEEDNPFGGDTVDAVVQRIVATQFPRDILTQAPRQVRRRGVQGSRYITLTDQEIHNVTLDTFRSTSVPFNRAWLKVVAVSRWKDILTELFPAKGFVKSGGQNYGNCQYLHQWALLMDNLSLADSETVRKRVLKELSTLSWLPYVTADRIWNTQDRSQRREWEWLSTLSAVDRAAPHLAIHSNRGGYSKASDVPIRLLQRNDTLQRHNLADESDPGAWPPVDEE